jgi:uncharacterized membrane protein
MPRSRIPGIDAIDDEGELVLLVSIPFVLLVSFLAVFGFETIAVIVAIVAFVGLIPLIMVFGDDLLNEHRSEDVTADPTDELREQYVAGELSETEFERAVEDELAGDEDRALHSPSEREARSDREREPNG